VEIYDDGTSQTTARGQAANLAIMGIQPGIVLDGDANGGMYFTVYHGKGQIWVTNGTSNIGSLNCLELQSGNVIIDGPEGNEATGTGTLTAKTLIAPTNYVAADFAPVAGKVKFPVYSNNWAFSVTQLSTNAVFQINP
jgi:hypothetical protein